MNFYTRLKRFSCENSTDVDHDPSKIAKGERKARVTKNQRQMVQNIQHAQGESTVVGPSSRELRKKEINRTLATSRYSTASMGRFDKVLDGEKKLGGMKRKVRPFVALCHITQETDLLL